MYVRMYIRKVCNRVHKPCVSMQQNKLEGWRDLVTCADFLSVLCHQTDNLPIVAHQPVIKYVH